jgi:hypothetical protein
MALESTSQDNTYLHRFLVNLSILPVIILGFLMVIYALGFAPWQADFEGATTNDTVSHWDRLNGNDLPENRDVERADGYMVRRIFDGTAYVSVVLGGLTVIALGFINRAWVFLPMVAIGLSGLLYAATSGLTVGPMILAGGYAMVFFGAIFGWVTSPKKSQQTTMEHNTNG